MTGSSDENFAGVLNKFLDLQEFSRALEMLEVKLGLAASGGSTRKWNKRKISTMSSSLWRNATVLGLDHYITKSDIDEFLLDCASNPLFGNLPTDGGPPQKSDVPSLIGRIRPAIANARDSLSDYPPCMEKTFTFFRSSLSRDPSAEGYVLLADSLPAEAKRDPKLDRLIDSPSSPALGHEGYKNVMRYRFLQAFASSKGTAEMDEIVQFFRRELNGFEEAELDTTGDTRLYPGAYPVGEILWLISLAPNLARSMRPEIRRALDKVMRAQDRRGWWAEHVFSREMPQEHLSVAEKVRGVRVPDPAATALCAVALQKLGDDRHIAAAADSARWLAGVQEPVGFWSLVSHKGDSRPHVRTSILAAEAILRAGLKDVERDIQRAEQWVISQQDSIGLWFDKFDAPEFLSMVICEYFRDRSKFRPLPLGHLTVARGFLRRAEELALDASSDAARLAVISGFHGVEMFLYGVAADERYFFDIFERGGNTIGLREAMARLRDKLREIAAIKSTSDLRWAHQMKMVASLRDQIIHKGHEVTPTMALQHVNQASAFVTHYGEELLQLQVLDR